MIRILMLAALAAHVSAYGYKGVTILTMKDFCENNRFYSTHACEASFANHLVANPNLEKCSPECPFYSSHCTQLPLDAETCSIQYRKEGGNRKEPPRKEPSDTTERITDTGNAVDLEEPPSSDPLYAKVMNFSLELFKKAMPKGYDQNYVLSPMMVQSLLSYLTSGASIKTRDDMDAVLQLSSSDLQSLREMLLPSAEQTVPTRNKLDIASQIFRSSRVQLLRPFQQSIKDKKVPLQEMDFSNKEHAANTINEWVTTQTRGKIQQAIDAESLNADTTLLLLNALYFNGTWMYKFNRTEKGSFEVYENHKISINMMHLTRHLRSGYTRVMGGWKPNEGFMWVELPYDGDTMSMILLLPKQRFQLDRELQDFTMDDLQYILSEIAENMSDEVKLQLPEFKADSSVSLVDPLKKMGLASMFDGENPFDRISNETVKVSEVKQRSHLSVNERGTVATSVTYATIIALSLPRSMEFHVNQPFAAIIIDKVNKIPLFMAKICKPEKFKLKQRG